MDDLGPHTHMSTGVHRGARSAHCVETVGTIGLTHLGCYWSILFLFLLDSFSVGHWYMRVRSVPRVKLHGS
jgi:hypothetical protein